MKTEINVSLKFKQIGGLKQTPMIVIILIILDIIFHISDVTILSIVFFAFWIVFAFGIYTQVLEINSETIKMHYFAGQDSISKSDINSIHHKWLKACGRGCLLIDVFELKSKDGKSVYLPRYGWSNRRKELFSHLSEWLKDAPIQIDENTMNFLKSAQN